MLCNQSKSPGFTLIELLVVVVIIGILATVVTAALAGTRVKARDGRRVADVRQLQTALELYFSDENTYPTTAAIVPGQPVVGTGGKTYMKQAPQNPGPQSEGACSSFSDYRYSQEQSGKSYRLDYCLAKGVAALPAGSAIATPTTINSATAATMTDTGWRSPASGSNYNYQSWASPWTSPGNVVASDDVSASFWSGDTCSDEAYLRASNFGFSIPAGATINGIEVRYERRGQSNDYNDKVMLNLSLFKGAGLYGNNIFDYNTYDMTDSYASYGGSSDLWGGSFTPTEINDSNFGFVVRICQRDNNVYVDHMQLKVYYTPN